MQERRSHPRVAYHLAVDLYRDRDGQPQRFETSDISQGGLFAIGALGLMPDDAVQVSLGQKERGALQLQATVARVSHNGAGVAFDGNGRKERELLAELLTPDWDGRNLLEGVVKMGPWYHDEDLAGWMRLTSMVTDWHRLLHAARREFQRSLESGRTPPSSS